MSAPLVSERYSRQRAMAGWDQRRLAETTVAVAGHGPIAYLSSLMLAAMGFGRLVLLGGCRHQQDGSTAFQARFPFESWADLLNRINPATQVYATQARLTADLKRRLPQVDSLIVAGNDIQAHQAGSVIAQRGEMTVAAGACAGRLGLWGHPIADKVMARIYGQVEGPICSQVIAGLLVEEVRKTAMPLSEEQGCASGRNALCLPLPEGGSRERYMPLSSAWRGIALVGAGALGTWFGIGLGLSGVRAAVTIYDDDEIEETNLNRQVLFYDAVGEAKAPTLAARLQKMFPSLTTCGYGVRVESGMARQVTQAPVLVACPDNFAVRALLNGLASRHDRVLISGGTSATGGSCVLYEPGQTACLSCRMRIEELARQEEAPQSCGRQVEASVVTSNAITGALMVWNLLGLLRGRREPGMWEYDGTVRDDRIGVRSPRPACECHLRLG